MTAQTRASVAGRHWSPMKLLKITALLVALPLAASAQDAVKVDAKHYKVLAENAVVRVLKVSYGVGERSPMHSHPDAVLVALANGKARFTMPDGKTQDVDIAADGALYTPAFTHAPANIGAGPIDAVLVEIKPKTGAAASLPAARPPGMANKVLAEGPGAVANLATLAPGLPRGRRLDPRIRPGRDRARRGRPGAGRRGPSPRHQMAAG